MLLQCDRCKKEFPEHMLDAKPPSLRNVKATNDMLIYAADNGEDFTVLQCKNCYGPAWEKGIPDD